MCLALVGSFRQRVRLVCNSDDQFAKGDIGQNISFLTFKSIAKRPRSQQNDRLTNQLCRRKNDSRRNIMPPNDDVGHAWSFGCDLLSRPQSKPFGLGTNTSNVLLNQAGSRQLPRQGVGEQQTVTSRWNRRTQGQNFAAPPCIHACAFEVIGQIDRVNRPVKNSIYLAQKLIEPS
ncbi:hypothetical protein RB9496 [Rhodopirellula baltica SH 1]|uniref:Uncharacterized protein n=1 Tax=Rhodopirellula baltica (strain DSM 10527 / NCIMB 13988 / SH1) TaxID=243090 RepID=Q7ULH8_RHOBA|nr:hypothetical protein RB9496 [Rhodopirellula baltica SH 1]